MMRHNLSSVIAGLLILTLLLASCSGDNSGDVFPGAGIAIPKTSGPDSFLLFPNPQKQADGSLQTNTTAYATAYYEAIDPNNDKDTLDKWKTANGFGSGTGTETTVVFGDKRDLGYGRRMTARQNTDGTIAVMVENYLVAPAAYYSYSSFNLDAAVVRDQRWHVGTNGIEFSGSTCSAQSDPASCDPSIKFAKFYTFDRNTGQRLLAADLDGRGDKAMPGICISCHGGRGDPLTPATGSPTGKALFPWVGNSASQKRGDTQAHMQPLIVDSFGYSTTPPWTRADQEAALKTINEWVLSSYPIPAATAFPEDAARRVAIYGEWNGTAANIIKQAYGGDGLPNLTFADSYVPTGWSNLGQTTLYQNVVAPYCRTCHIQRGTNAMDELNFDNYCYEDGANPGNCDPTLTGYYFKGYADRIKAHVIDRGNMPLARIVYARFWGSSDPDTLAAFLQSAQSQPVLDSNNAVLRPGRPIADPGPDRTTTSPVTLSAANSLYATTYTWSVVSGTGVLSNPTSATPTLTASDGVNVLQLVVGNGTTVSDPAQVTVTIDSTMGTGGKLTATPHFADIKAVLQGPPGCYGCHTPGGGPPIFYTDIDRNGDSLINATDDQWFYTELRGRINFTDVAASPLLRKPTGHHHGGGLVLDFTNSAACAPATCGSAYTTYGAYYAAAYNMFVNWILNGAPY
jgi:mono/diheme cytochrome c family protein